DHLAHSPLSRVILRERLPSSSNCITPNTTRRQHACALRSRQPTFRRPTTEYCEHPPQFNPTTTTVTMASTAKYTAAPQEDPDAHTSYTQPPPSYQAESNSAQDNAALFGGAPRSSEDNIPDDFKFGGSVAEATLEIRNQFIRKVYTILTVQLLATALVSSLSFMSDGYRNWIQNNPTVLWLSLFGSMGFMILTYWKRHSYPTNLLFLSGFTLLEAYTISVIVSFYDSSIVLNAVVLTGGIFIFLTAFACQSKYDFTSWMPYLFGALWGLVLFGFMSFFLPRTSTTELIYGLLAALIFSGYILVDTQLVMRKHHVEEEIAAALSLYLDIINLFLAILRILNSQNNN
ncbi:inhibitor of apoptosis-promoting Bax1-domain-containing protein, partial [Triangularia verruculosa]